MHIEYDCEIPLNGRMVGAVALIATDGAGIPDVTSIMVPAGDGYIRINKLDRFRRAAAYIRQVCWADVLLQLDIRRHEIARLADRFEALARNEADSITVSMAAYHAAHLRAHLADARRAA